MVLFPSLCYYFFLSEVPPSPPLLISFCLRTHDYLMWVWCVGLHQKLSLLLKWNPPSHSVFIFHFCLLPVMMRWRSDLDPTVAVCYGCVLVECGVSVDPEEASMCTCCPPSSFWHSSNDGTKCLMSLHEVALLCFRLEWVQGYLTVYTQRREDAIMW